MSLIHIKYKHSLNPEETRKRVEEIAKDLKKEYKIDYAWKGDRLLFKRSGAVGNLDIGDGFIELKIKLGVVLAPLKGKIEKTVRQNIAAEMSGKKGTKLA
jgi:putative polyhydroxyalkanoate system protein